MNGNARTTSRRSVLSLLSAWTRRPWFTIPAPPLPRSRTTRLALSGMPLPMLVPRAPEREREAAATDRLLVAAAASSRPSVVEVMAASSAAAVRYPDFRFHRVGVVIVGGPQRGLFTRDPHTRVTGIALSLL